MLIKFPLTAEETLEIETLLSIANNYTKCGNVVFSKTIREYELEFNLEIVAGDDDFWMQIVVFERGIEVSCTDPMFELDTHKIELSDKYSVVLKQLSFN